MSELESGFRIADVVGLIKRRSAIMLVSVVVGLILGYLAFASSPTSYSATARVQVQPLGVITIDSEAKDTAKLDVGTEQDLVKSDAVGDVVRKKLDLPGDNRSLFSSLTVTSKEDSLVLELTVTSPDAAKAQAKANAIAEAYLAERQREAEQTRDDAKARIEAQRVNARAALSEATDAYDKTRAGTTARAQAQVALQDAQQVLGELNKDFSDYDNLDVEGVGKMVRKASLPSAVLSKKALAKGVGVFGLCVLAGFVVAVFIDRRDSLGGGRRKVQQIAPGANIRILPTARGGKASAAEVDAAIDRLAVDLVAHGSRGRAASVLVVGTRPEPPVALSEELAASLTFAGIPALFVLAGSSERELRQAQVITSFTDLITGPSITGPASLPEVAGSTVGVSAPTVTWLRPRGSAESSGLLRRAVVEALITRAGREGFEAVIFVAATPTFKASAAALGQWVDKTAVVVEDDDGQAVEAAVDALEQADVTISEVVWT